MSNPTPELVQAARVIEATEMLLASNVQAFRAEVFRGDVARLNRATEAAHQALQDYLDAIASAFAVAARDQENGSN